MSGERGMEKERSEFKNNMVNIHMRWLLHKFNIVAHETCQFRALTKMFKTKLCYLAEELLTG